MPIEWRPDDRQLHLYNDRLSYIVAVHENGTLGLLHLGAPLAVGRSYRHLARSPFQGFSNRIDAVRLEVPTAGSGDFRVPAVGLDHPDGSTVLDLVYAGHTIRAGKPVLAGLPAAYVEDDAEADTIEVALIDRVSGIEVVAAYTVFRDHAAIARNVRVRNGGSAAVDLRTVMSASLDLADNAWRLTTLSGAWARERDVVTRDLVPGRQSVGSLRGASGHQHNPFLCLHRPTTTEANGEALGMSLVYSGNFLAEVEVDELNTVRARIGIHPEEFGWRLQPGAEFQAPEAVVAWSGEGLGGLSDTYHRLYRERLARGTWRDRPRPVVLNNWEATYFNFDETKLLSIATAARDLGVEVLVLDDGWFGRRDDDTTSLGDWFVDRRKLPNGIEGLARKVTDLGIGFGLWIEPEMISERSELFAAHPDWAIGVPGRPRTERRNQYVLDLSRPEVVEHLFGVLSDVIGSAPIAYLKWDMNRNITEPFTPTLPPERQTEFFHRYMLGVYELYRRLTGVFPDILFESCAGGGGRFDPGILAYAPQGWASDDTDAVERLRIQWGTSMVYPISSIGAHVAAVPNHQVGRVTPLTTRAAVAFFGSFGYELDPTAFTDEERSHVAEHIAWFKERRAVLQFGRFLRLRSPFEGDGNETAWMTVDAEAGRAVVGWYRELSRPSPGPSTLRLRGLDPGRHYRITLWPATDDALVRANSIVRGGDELMAVGLFLDDDPRESALRGDFQARLFELEAVRAAAERA